MQAKASGEDRSRSVSEGVTRTQRLEASYATVTPRSQIGDLGWMLQCLRAKHWGDLEGCRTHPVKSQKQVARVELARKPYKSLMLPITSHLPEPEQMAGIEPTARTYHALMLPVTLHLPISQAGGGN